MPDALVRHQLEVLAAEGVAIAGAEIRKRHLERAARLGLQVVHLAGEPVRWKPFGHRIGIEERAIHALRRSLEHAVKPYSACGHGGIPFAAIISLKVMSGD